MVNLVIMRHGDAEPQSSQDSQRQLTAKGRADVTLMAQWAATNYQPFDYILYSPFVRTQQTAELMRLAQLTTPITETLAELVPEGDCNQVQLYIDVLLQQKPDARILLVSHMPLVSFLVETFGCVGQTPIFETAALVSLYYEVGNCGAILERMTVSDLPSIA